MWAVARNRRECRSGFAQKSINLLSYIRHKTFYKRAGRVCRFCGEIGSYVEHTQSSVSCDAAPRRRGRRIACICWRRGGSPTFSPLYQQIKTLILQSLQAGEWKPGEMIPSEMELAARYKVSQGTVRKAIDELAAENLVARRQGKGTFVTTHYEEGCNSVSCV